ncbi:MAG: glycosyltransferase family 39 protein [Desulfurobacteriaceae bacterium]
MVKSRKFLFILLASLTLLLLPNGLYSAFDKDEPKYLEAAWEMVKKGDFITPYYNYEYRFDKPVLIYWLISLGYKLFGVNEFGGRFFVSIFGVLTVILLFWWLKKREGEDLAFVSSLVLLTSLDFIVMSSVAMPDVVLTFFIAASLISFFEGYVSRSKNWYRLAFLFSGLATLTKGPVGLVLPGLIAVVFLVLRRDLLKTLRDIPWVSGFLVYFAVVLPWYGAILAKHGRDFFMDFIVFHNIHRFTGKIPGHPTQWWYYIANYFWLYLPWSFVFPFALYRAFKSKESITEPLLNFSIVWFFTVFLFFQIAHTKLAHYLLPSFPAFSVIVGWYLLKFKERLPYLITGGFLIILSVAGFGFWFYKGWPLWGVLFLLFPLTGGLLSIKFNDYRPLAYGFLSGMLLFKWVALPSLEPFRAKPQVGKALRSLKKVCPECKVAFFDYTSPEIVYYYRLGKLEDLNRDRVEELLKSSEPAVIVTRENRLKKLKGVNYVLLDKKRELITNHSIVVISNRELKEWRR